MFGRQWCLADSDVEISAQIDIWIACANEAYVVSPWPSNVELEEWKPHTKCWGPGIYIMYVSRVYLGPSLVSFLTPIFSQVELVCRASFRLVHGKGRLFVLIKILMQTKTQQFGNSLIGSWAKFWQRSICRKTEEI